MNSISPNVLGLFEVVSEERDGKDIVHVIVSGGMEKPYYLKQKGMTPDGCFVRIGSSVHGMSERMILEAFSNRA